MAHFEHEIRLKLEGYSTVCGIDEAGRGPLAGPVVAAACYFEEPVTLPHLTDSKKLSKARREALFEQIQNSPDIHFAYAVIDSLIIDEINILEATMLAMKEATDALMQKAPLSFALIDGNRAPKLSIPSLPIIKGDSISASIAAASIVAKVKRDHLMQAFDQEWPHYGFAKHMGYGTKAHLAAIQEYGPSPIHRLSFAPLKANLQSS